MDEKLQCLICYKWFSHLGSHIASKHKITAREYKVEFGLDITKPLVTRSISNRLREANEDNKDIVRKALVENGKKYRFKKGHKSRAYYSEESIQRALKNLKKINDKPKQKCGFCSVITDHLESHIYNAHGYIKVKHYK